MVREFASQLWAECRQTARLGEPLAMGAAAWMVGVWAIWGGTWPYRGLMHPAAGLYLIFAAALVGATAFAPGGPTGGLAFLAEKPADRWRAWLAKGIVRYGLWLIVAAEAAALSRLLGVAPGGDMGGALDAFWPLGPPTLAFCFLASAALRRRTLAFLPGGLLGLAVSRIAVGAYPLRALGGAASVAVLCVLLLAASGLVVSRRPPAAMRAWRAAAFLGGATGILVAAAIASHFLCLHLALASLGPHCLERAAVGHPSPDGRMLELRGTFRITLLRSRTGDLCVLDTQTATLRLVTRGQCGRTRGSPWSPDGRYLIYLIDRFDWSWLETLRASLGFRVREPSDINPPPPSTHVFDTATGRSHSLPYPAYRLAGWLEAGRALAQGPARTAAIYDAATHKLERVVLPDGSREFGIVSPYPMFGVPALRRESKDRVWGPLLFYDRTTRGWVERPFPKAPEPPPDGSASDAPGVSAPRDDGYGDPSVQGSVEAISGDGPYVVFVRRPLLSKAAYGYELFDLAQGTTRLLRDVPREGRTWYSGHWWFSQGGQWLLFSDTRTHAPPSERSCLYNTRTGQARRLAPPPAASDSPTFSGDGARLLWWSQGPPGIVIEDPATGERRTLTLDAMGLAPESHWSWWATADWLGLAVNRPAGPELFRVRWDGTGLERIYPKGGR